MFCSGLFSQVTRCHAFYVHISEIYLSGFHYVSLMEAGAKWKGGFQEIKEKGVMGLVVTVLLENSKHIT